MDPAGTIEAFRARWRTFSESRHGRAIIRTVRAVFLLGVLAYLVLELTRIGWDRIWRSLPTQPLFYVLFLVIYLLLPVSEVLIYRLSWTFDALRSLPAFLKKRVYNREVLGYSGEVYFFTWARTRVDAGERRILETIRDNNLISSVASTVIAVVLLAVFLMVGELRITDLVGDRWLYYAVGAVVVIAVLIPIFIRFRRYLFSMPVRTASAVFSIHVARLLLIQVVQIAQWAVVLPDVPLRIWFTFAAASILISRIPFIPNQSLIFMGVGVELSGVMDMPTEVVAGMLLVSNVIDKLLNVGLFGLISVYEPRSERAKNNSAA